MASKQKCEQCRKRVAAVAWQPALDGEKFRCIVRLGFQKAAYPAVALCFDCADKVREAASK